MELGSKDIKVVAFDADDTLWDCQSWFDQVEHQCGNLLRPWATQEEVSQSLFATERGNMELLGYGTKAFTISLVENAVRVTKGQITGDIVAQLIQLGKGLLRFPTTPLPEVEHTLQRLSSCRLHQGRAHGSGAEVGTLRSRLLFRVYGDRLQQG